MVVDGLNVFCLLLKEEEFGLMLCREGCTTEGSGDGDVHAGEEE